MKKVKTIKIDTKLWDELKKKSLDKNMSTANYLIKLIKEDLKDNSP